MMSARAPAAGGTATTFKVGIANTYSVECYGTGLRLGQCRQLPVRHHRQHRLVAGRRHLPVRRGQPGLYHLHLRLGHHRALHRHLQHHRDPDGNRRRHLPGDLHRHPRARRWQPATAVPGPSPWPPSIPTCIDPASGGTATTFYENTANSYTVECEAQSGVSGTSAYPSSIAINTGSLPADGNPTFATSTSSSPGLHHQPPPGPAPPRSTSSTCALADHPDLLGCRHLPLDLHGHRTRWSRYRHLGHPDRDRRPADHDLHGAGRRGDLHLLDRRHGRRATRSPATAPGSPRPAPATTRPRSPSTPAPCRRVPPRPPRRPAPRPAPSPPRARA